jgi:glycosyltransferase involved in cell wall biosynthesis
LQQAVTFVGSVSRSLIFKYLSAADIFVFTTLREEVGVPLNLLEALSCGLPCIVSEYIISHGLDIIRTNAGAPSDIAAAISAVLLKNKFDDRISRLPRELGLSETIDKYIDLFSGKETECTKQTSQYQ